jgi:hypothetical protein
MEPASLKEWQIARLWEIAATTPEDSRGNLRGQIRACKMMYSDFEYQPALQRLGEIVKIDPARTKGHRRDQEAAAKMLKGFVYSIKPDKSGVQ